MKTTETAPITCAEDIKKLLSIPGRDGFLFCVGLYTALRISEYRIAQWSYFIEDGNPKDGHRYEIMKKRRKAYRYITYPDELKKKIAEAYEEEGFPPLDWYVFTSQRRGMGDAITTRGVNDHIIKKHIKALNIKVQNASSHTLRKTMAREFYYSNNMNLALTMEMLGQTDQGVTLRYIGVKGDEMKSACSGFGYSDKKSISIKYKVWSKKANGYAQNIVISGEGDLFHVYENKLTRLNPDDFIIEAI